METPFSLVERAPVAIDSEPQKPVTKVTARSFVMMACLMAPDLPLATGGTLAVTINGQAVATYPGKRWKFSSSNLRG
jgi:hypothetical protein